MANQSVAYDLDMYKPTAPKVREVKAVAKAPAVKKKRKSELVLLCAITACIAAFMVYSRVSLNEITGNLNSAKSSLVTVSTEQNRLSRLVDMKMSLANIEKYATTKLGMIKPDASQIRYITLSDTNKIEMKDSGFALPATITGAFDKLRSYFD